MSVQVYSLLGQTEQERKAFLKDARRRAALWDSPQEHLVVIRDEKVSLFVKFEIILPLPLFFIRSPNKQALKDMEFYDKLLEQFQDLSKVKDPAVSKAKV